MDLAETTVAANSSFFHDNPDAALPRPFGKYTLLARIATGGMAHVYLALLRAEFGVEKLVVVKCLLAALSSQERFLSMFLDEARVAATLTHPNIAEVFDAGEVDGTYFIAMEYVEGEDLRELRRALRTKDQRALPPEHALYIITKVLSGLEYAHKKTDFSGAPLDIVHCDVSPQNVMVTFAGNVKVVDFGVAKSALQLDPVSSAEQIKGKVSYMSPEQARGDDLDARSDLFAVSILLYELTTGARVFRAETHAETLRRVKACEYHFPRQIAGNYPEELEAIVVRGLRADPALRYQSAREMQLDLLAFAESYGLALEDGAFAEWLASALAERREQQQSLIRQVRELAARADYYRPSRVPGTSSPAPGEEVSDSGAGHPSSLAGAAQTLPFSEPPPARSPVRLVVLGLALTALVVAVFGGWVLMSGAGDGQGGTERASFGFELKRVWGELRAPRTAGKVEDTISIELEFVPKNAAAWIDGALVTSKTVEVKPGASHELRVDAPGHWPRTFKFSADKPGQLIKVELDPATHEQ